MEKIAYIDGDILPYKVGFATQRTIYTLHLEGLHSCSPVLTTKSKVKVNKYVKATPELVVTTTEYLETEAQAIITLKLNMQSIIQGSRCDRFKVVLSGEDNFRERIATIQKYKGNRDGSEKPAHWKMLREWLIDKPYTIVSEDEEADDVLSKAMMDGHVGCTIDKDLDNTPGFHYNFNKKTLYTITEAEGMRNFYTQMLTGDKADNIPGIKGIGPKKAEKLLADCETPHNYEDVIYDVYCHSGVYEDVKEAMTEVGRLLWMRRTDGEMWTLTI